MIIIIIMVIIIVIILIIIIIIAANATIRVVWQLEWNVMNETHHYC